MQQSSNRSTLEDRFEYPQEKARVLRNQLELSPSHNEPFQNGWIPLVAWFALPSTINAVQSGNLIHPTIWLTSRRLIELITSTH